MFTLERVIKYIRHTREKGIILESSKMLQVEACVDVSLGIHEGFRRLTGSTFSISFSQMYRKSSNQKVNMKSSVDSELVLVGLSDSTGQIILTRNFLINQGYEISQVTI